MGENITRKLQQAVLGESVRYQLSPAISAAGAGGTGVLSGGAAYGLYVDIVAAKAIATEFWCCGFYTDTATALGVWTIEWNRTIGGPAYVILGYGRVHLTAVTANIGYQEIGPYPLYQPALTNIQARTRHAVANTINLSLLYAIALI